jgi:hypothetical protein
MYLVEEKSNNMTCISYIANPRATILDTPPNNHYKKNMVFFIGESNEKNPIWIGIKKIVLLFWTT